MPLSSDDRQDPLDRYYKNVERAEKFSSWLFWAGAFLSIAILYSNSIQYVSQPFATNLFILTVVIHSCLVHFSALYLLQRAEAKRREQLLSDSFDVSLTHQQTRRYYNNPISPSVERLGAAILENAFFSQRIAEQMSVYERIRVGAYGLVWLSALTLRTTDLGLILIISQLVFSGDIILRWLRVEFLRSRTEQVYDNLYRHFLHRVESSEQAGIADILDNFAKYECAKARASIKLSTKIFFRNNDAWSTEWQDICKHLGITPASERGEVEGNEVES